MNRDDDNKKTKTKIETKMKMEDGKSVRCEK